MPLLTHTERHTQSKQRVHCGLLRLRMLRVQRDNRLDVTHCDVLELVGLLVVQTLVRLETELVVVGVV